MAKKPPNNNPPSSPPPPNSPPKSWDNFSDQIRNNPISERIADAYTNQSALNKETGEFVGLIQDAVAGQKKHNATLEDCIHMENMLADKQKIRADSQKRIDDFVKSSLEAGKKQIAQDKAQNELLEDRLKNLKMASGVTSNNFQGPANFNVPNRPFTERHGKFSDDIPYADAQLISSGGPPPLTTTPPPLPSEMSAKLAELAADEHNRPDDPNAGLKHVPGLGMMPDMKDVEAALAEQAQAGKALSDQEFIVPDEPTLSRGEKFLRYIDNYIHKLGLLERDVRKAHKLGIFGKAAMALQGSPGAVAVAGIGSLFTAGLGAMGGILGLIKKAFFATYEYINTKVLPTQATLNRALGSTANQMGSVNAQAMALGHQFWDLGLGFENGVKDATDISVALRNVNIPKANMDTLVKVAEYVGVGAEQAGNLGRSFEATGGSIKDLDKIMAETIETEKEFGVPANIIRKDFAENIDIMQRFGTRNAIEFRRAVGRAQSYGMSIREVNQTFGETLDTFETTSDAAAKLNQAFGTNIDSLKLLRQTDPTKRFEMIRKELAKQRIVWDNIDPFYKNLLKSTLPGLTDQTGALAFGTQKLRMQTKLQMQAEAGRIQNAKKWENAMADLRTQLLSTEQIFNNFFRAVGNVVMRLLGFKSGIDGTTKFAEVFKEVMGKITERVNEFASVIPVKEGSKPPIVVFFDKITEACEKAQKTLNKFYDFYKDVTTFGEGNATKLSNKALELAKDSQKNFEEILAFNKENMLPYDPNISIWNSSAAEVAANSRRQMRAPRQLEETLDRMDFKGVHYNQMLADAKAEQRRLQKEADELWGKTAANAQTMSRVNQNQSSKYEQPTINIFMDSRNMMSLFMRSILNNVRAN